MKSPQMKKKRSVPPLPANRLTLKELARVKARALAKEVSAPKPLTWKQRKRRHYPTLSFEQRKARHYPKAISVPSNYWTSRAQGRRYQCQACEAEFTSYPGPWCPRCRKLNQVIRIGTNS